MFKTAELFKSLNESWFKECHINIERNILRERLGFKRSLKEERLKVLAGRFSQAVLASAPQWDFESNDEARVLCTAAADIEAGLGLILSGRGRLRNAQLYFLRASILYDLAGMPGAAASIAAKSDLDTRISNLFTRRPNSLWGQLIGSNEILNAAVVSDSNPITEEDSILNLVQLSISEAINEYGRVLQSNELFESSSIIFLASLARSASGFSIGIGSDEIAALKHILIGKKQSLTSRVVKNKSSLDSKTLSALGAPLELWPVQKLAVTHGLFEENIKGFGLAAPTGTGKTFLTRILIADFYQKHPDQKVIYICPNRALVFQVGADLRTALRAYPGREDLTA